jgi:acyl carrier protein
MKPAPAETAFVAPRTEIEIRLAQIWTHVLQVETVGVHDNFFRLGGHSLLALQVMARIRDTFKTDLPLRTLFEFPTIATLAEAVAHPPLNGASGPIKKLARGSSPAATADAPPLPRPIFNAP